jgi:hypothetical protein
MHGKPCRNGLPYGNHTKGVFRHALLAPCASPSRTTGGCWTADHLLVHLSPLGWEHFNLTGDYARAGVNQVTKNPDGFRPLRTRPVSRYRFAICPLMLQKSTVRSLGPVSPVRPRGAAGGVRNVLHAQRRGRSPRPWCSATNSAAWRCRWCAQHGARTAARLTLHSERSEECLGLHPCRTALKMTLRVGFRWLSVPRSGPPTSLIGGRMGSTSVGNRWLWVPNLSGRSP